MGLIGESMIGQNLISLGFFGVWGTPTFMERHGGTLLAAAGGTLGVGLLGWFFKGAAREIARGESPELLTEDAVKALIGGISKGWESVRVARLEALREQSAQATAKVPSAAAVLGAMAKVDAEALALMQLQRALVARCAYDISRRLASFDVASAVAQGDLDYTAETALKLAKKADEATAKAAA